MVEIVVSVAAKVSEYLVDLVVRQLGYLFNYRTNIEDLSQKVEKLRNARDRHLHSVDEAIRNGHEIEDDVCNWLASAGKFIEAASKFLEDDEKEARKSCFNGLCPNLKYRYQLSREARKRAVVAIKIHGDGKFEKVSYRAPLQEIRSAPSEVLQSRMRTLNEVMEALRDANINRIGVWGLGGVGKSTLVKQVAEQAEKEKLFDKVVTASVLQTPDYKRIQGELADKLGMKFEEESEQGRAARLHQRMKEEKTILVILDDLWTELELEKIGIPSPDDHKGCKLVLTSRNKQVLSNEMGTQKDFRVEHLQEDEAWILFKNRAGDSVEKPDLHPIAFEVAKECAGLPIAIVTVATALKNRVFSIWMDALHQLKTQTSTNIPGMEKKVYSSLKLSYDFLQGDEVKSFFLFCGLLSSYIHIRDLLKYGMGLRLFQRTNTLEEARNRIDTLVDHLKASNLLLDTGHHAFVRMHDVVRNVASEIASREHHELRFEKGVRVEEWPKMDEYQKFTMIDVDVYELPEGLIRPKLEFFGCYDLQTNSAVKIPNTLFEGMKQLKVLYFSGMHLPSLPSSLQCLANLRTLCLDRCKLGDIVIIAGLKKLEILSLMDSDLEQLPREIAQLTHLRLLDLRGSSKLKVVPPDVISCLFRLEELCMENSFTQWEGEGKSNACLAELKHLSHLTSLDIQIPDAKLLPKDIVFDNLVRYRIFVGDVWSWEENFEINKTLKLNKFDTSLHLVDGISKLLKRTEDLHLRELCGGTNVLSKLNRESFLELKHLNVESSPEIQSIANSMDLTSSHGAFPVMETLSLKQLINLQEVCHGQFPAGSLGCLRKVEVEDCDGLTFLFSLSVARGLSRLEEIKVARCKSMVEMVSRGRKEIKEDAVNVPLFPELRCLTLQDLPKLSSFCIEENPLAVLFDERVSFPSLKSLNISGLDNVKRIWHYQLPQDSFSKLEVLKVASCGELLNIFPSSSFMLKMLQSLQLLQAKDCSSLEEVFDVEGINVNGKEGVTVTQLSELILKSLPKVEKIWNKDPHGILTFQNLKIIDIEKCQGLKNLFPASLVRDLVQLQELEVWSCEMEEIVAKDNGIEGAATFVFPKVTTLTLCDLHQLRSFYPGAHTSQWPLLEILWVSGCDKVNVFAFETPTFQQRHHEGNLFLLQQVAFPNSEELVLDTEISQEQFPVDSFPKLRVLYVYNNRDILVAIPSFLLQRLQNLEVLTVGGCSSVKEVFQLEGLDEENQAKRLGRLREIWLDDLPGLTHLWKENSKPGPDLQSLESLKVWNCESLINLAPSSVFFQNLASLDVQSCGSLRSLISPSVAKTLVKLKTLKIGGSHMMEEVVANEGGEAADEIAFGKLQHMELVCLPNLTSFSSGGYIFSFPSLEHMVVKECPKMKIFSPGLITTPRLETIEVGDDEWHWQDDLNTTIQNLFIKTHGNVDVVIVQLGADSAL